jgi:asparagine synthase (glutamine-hydrolysing)
MPEEPVPFVAEDGSLVGVGDARLDARDALCDSLGLRSQAADMELLTEAYRRWGDDCCRRLRGDFAFAILDRRDGTLFAAADPMGARRLFHTQPDPDTFVLSSEESCLLALPGMDERWDAASVLTWLAAAPFRGSSMFAEIGVISCGSRLRRDSEGLETGRWWNPFPAQALQYASDDEYAEHYRALMRAAIADRMRTDTGVVACELSGGMDSGTVAALAAGVARERGIRLVAISHLYPAFDGCDERRPIRAARERLGIEGVEFDAARIMAESYPLGFGPRTESPSAYDHPLQLRVIAEAAKLGADVILTGHGGDELTTGNCRWTARERFLRGDMGVIGDLLADARTRGIPVVRTLAGRLGKPLLKGLLGRRIMAALARAGFLEMPLPGWLAGSPGLRRMVAGLLVPAADFPGSSPADRDVLSGLRGSTALPYLDAYRLNAIPRGICVRSPFYDERLARFVFGTGPVPWCGSGYTKRLSRQALAGLLGEDFCWGVHKVNFGDVCDLNWSARVSGIAEVFNEVIESGDAVSRLYKGLPARIECQKVCAHGMDELFALLLALWLNKRRFLELGVIGDGNGNRDSWPGGRR